MTTVSTEDQNRNIDEIDGDEIERRVTYLRLVL